MQEAFPTIKKKRHHGASFGLTLLMSVATVACTSESATIESTVVIDATGEQNALQLTTVQAKALLAELPIKGRAPKTGYSRDEFGNGWDNYDGCDTRNFILQRDLVEQVLDESGCKVLTGTLHDPYTNTDILFTRGVDTSGDVQIDHIVALSDAWQKGAQQLTYEERVILANDPLELWAVDGRSNAQKGDGDAATWLPPNKSIRCTYIAKQILVKERYELWITQAEHDAMDRVLDSCPGQTLLITN